MREMRRRATEMLAPIAPTIDVDRAVGGLTIGQQQMLQIAGAIAHGARIIIFDEPTSSLSQHEAERLYELIVRLRERRVTCIYVSHRLEEIFRLCDHVTVLRDGRHVATKPVADVDRAGARRDDDRTPRSRTTFPRTSVPMRATSCLRVEHLSSPGSFTRRVVLGANGRSRRVRRARRRRPIRGRARHLRARSAGHGRRARARPPRGETQPRGRDRAAASAWSPRIGSVRAWCCR